MAAPHTRLGPHFADAVAWVCELHADQSRPGTDIAYVSHLLAVASLVIEDGGDEDDAITALCHDAVENQGGQTTLDELRRRFGDEVADAVDLLSDSYGEPKAPWSERKRAMVARFAAGVPERVLRVAVADKLHNARTLLLQIRQEGDRVWRRFSVAPDEVVWFYRAMADVLADQYPGNANVDELGRVVTELAMGLPEGEVSVPA